MFVVVAYDIHNDRRRLRVHKTLKNFGRPVQYSTFECLLEPSQLERLRDALSQQIDAEADEVAYYGLCRVCAGRVDVLSGTPQLRQKHTVIV